MICNLNTLKYLAEHPRWARSWSSRLRGMLLRRFCAGEFDALVFEGCSAVCGFGLTRRIDAVFLDPGNRVVALRKNFLPCGVVFGGRSAVTTVELPPGALERSGTRVGHVLNLNSELTPEAVALFSAAAASTAGMMSLRPARPLRLVRKLPPRRSIWADGS